MSSYGIQFLVDAIKENEARTKEHILKLKLSSLTPESVKFYVLKMRRWKLVDSKGLDVFK